MQQPRDPRPVAGAGDRARQLDVGAREVRPPGRARPAVQDSDQIDDRIVPAHEPRSRSVLMHVGAHDLDGGQHQQVLRMREPPGRHRDAHAFGDEPPDDGGADETGPADDQHPANLHAAFTSVADHAGALPLTAPRRPRPRGSIPDAP